MVTLIGARIVQGVGAGGIFALVYIVLADVSTPETRGRTLSLASSIWGIASVLGPTMGGFIVTYFSWRWIFFINMPLGAVSLWGIGSYLVDLRSKKETVSLDLLGVATLSTAILAFLFAFLLGGRTYAWSSPPIIGLLALSGVGCTLFIRVENRARDPLLPVQHFSNRSFSVGNTAVFSAVSRFFPCLPMRRSSFRAFRGKPPCR